MDKIPTNLQIYNSTFLPPPYLPVQSLLFNPLYSSVPSHSFFSFHRSSPCSCPCLQFSVPLASSFSFVHTHSFFSFHKTSPRSFLVFSVTILNFLSIIIFSFHKTSPCAFPMSYPLLFLLPPLFSSVHTFIFLIP